MNIDRKRELVQQQINEANDGHPTNFDEWQNKTEVVLRTVFGAASPLHARFEAVRYSPSMWTAGTDFKPYEVAGVKEAITILESAKLELELAAEVDADVRGPVSGSQQDAQDGPGGRIFIVHGHDQAKKYELARFLERLTKVEPTILHEQPNGGRVLLEKFESHAGAVGFAVVLLTGDDFGRAKTSPDGDRLRARQNVVFELGFFCGAFGRSRTAVLFEEGVEMPSDLDGLAYIPLDVAGAWKATIAREIESAAIEVDWSALR